MKLTVLFSVALWSAQSCTTLIAGKKATKDGSVLATHSDDGESNSDARIVVVPAADHSKGSMRDIFYDTEDFPRYVGKGRGIPAYYPTGKQAVSKPIGQLPQVNHTYQYLEATYGIINEHQVGIGETTCSGVFGTNAVGHGGKALLSIDSMSRLALERCATSRCAVQTMGDLAVAHGFYGAGSFEGTAESLMVIDPNEGFIFHVLPDDTGSSAIWVAQRVDDDHVGVVANMFTIRKVDLTNKQKFLGSDNMHAIAKKHGWWKESDGNLDFTKCFSDGEYAHKFYSGRRMWGAYRIWGNDLPDNYTNLKYQGDIYPTTMVPAHKTDQQEMMKIHRYYYQGTKYDMTKGIAAGAFGNPDRFSGNENSKVKGHWERSIGLFRTSETHVVQAHAKLAKQGGVVYYAPSCATGSVFTPFAANVSTLPVEYTDMNPTVVDHTSAYWAHRYVYNFAHIRYSDMMTDVSTLQNKLETASVALVNAQAAAAFTQAEITLAYSNNAKNVVREWWTLPDMLMAKYADGWLNNGSPIGYNDDWLSSKAVGYVTGPPGPPKPTPGPGLRAPAPAPGANSNHVDGLKACIAGCGTESMAKSEYMSYRKCVERCVGHD